MIHEFAYNLKHNIVYWLSFVGGGAYGLAVAHGHYLIPVFVAFLTGAASRYGAIWIDRKFKKQK